MFKRLKEINIDKMENKILLGQVIIWFILVSFKDIIPSYLNTYIYWGIFMLATHICMKNKKALIPIGIYLIFAFLTEPFIDSSYLRELINRTTGILIGSLSILYFFKDSERQVPIQVERLATYMMAFLYFGVVFGALYGILELIDYLFSVDIMYNDFTENIILGIASSIGIFILFYKRDNEEEGIELYKESGKTNLYGTLVLKVLPPILIVFNILGIIATTKGIIFALSNSPSYNSIEYVISISLFSLNHIVAFYKADRTQNYFRYANFYYILYVAIIAYKELTHFQIYPFFLIVWFAGITAYLNFVSIKEKSYRSIPKLLIIFATISFIPFIGVASNDYFNYLTEKNRPYDETWGIINETPSTFREYMSKKINDGYNKAPYKYYIDNKNNKNYSTEYNMYKSIYFSAGYIFSEDKYDYDVSKFNTLSPFDTHSMEWGMDYKLKNFTIKTKNNELIIQDGNTTIWTINIETMDSQELYSQAEDKHYIEIRTDSGVILISELSINSYDKILRWSMKGLIIN